MKSILFASLLFLGVFANASVDSIRAEEGVCLDAAVNNAEIKQCIFSAYEKADQELNTVYQNIVSKLKNNESDTDSSEILKRLVSAERAWIAFRDADCSLAATEMLNGSGESTINGSCLVEKTLNRIDELTKILGQDN